VGYGDHPATGSTCTNTLQQENTPKIEMEWNGHESHAHENEKNESLHITHKTCQTSFSKQFPVAIFRCFASATCWDVSALSCYPGWAAGSGADRQWMVTWESDRKLGWNVSSLKGSKGKVLDGAKLGNSVFKRSKTMWDSSPDWLKARITINPCQLSIFDGLLHDFL
jgi:hypothetical protein